MEDICHHINIDIDGIDEKDVHAHLIVNPSLHLIPFKVYFNKSLEGKKTQLVDWIKSQKDYSEFGKKLSVTKINNPNYVIDIDYSNSKIGLIADTNIGEDRDGKFIGFGFKQVTIDYKQNSKIDPKRIQSVIFLDNHAYNLINSISEVDSFQTDPKQWKSTSKQTNLIEFGECSLELDFLETIEYDKDSYPLVIDRKPRVILHHTEMDLDDLFKYSSLITSCLSFFQGSDIDYKAAIVNNSKIQKIQYRPKKEKEKILNKNLGRFQIDNDIFLYLSKINAQLVSDSDFFFQIIKLFNQALSSEGTTEFMLYFTVIEKLRSNLQKGKPDKEKFTFTNGKGINKIIREKLSEIHEFVKEDEREIFENAIEDKLINIKYLPQKDQFTEFFALLNLDPANFDIEWKKVVGLRGAIFHGKYIESDDPQLIEFNSKVRTFTGNLIFNYLTNKMDAS